MGFAREAAGYIASGAKSMFKKKKKAPAGGQKGFVKEAASASKANMARGAKKVGVAKKKGDVFHAPSLAKKLQGRKKQRQKMLSQI